MVKMQRIFFVLGIMVISLLCILKMNMSFNRLSRYQYTQYMTKEEQTLVSEHLTYQEIEYLIEFAIAPKEYLDYIKEKRFSIYHIEEYNALKTNHPYLTASQIVAITEEAALADEENSEYTVELISELLNNYDYDTVLFWIQNKDLYNPTATLIISAANLDTFLTADRSISTRVPAGLKLLQEVPVLDDEKEIWVSSLIIEPLESLCKAIVEDRVSSRACGGLVVIDGYISYQDQEKIFQLAEELYGDEVLYYADYPGHSEHQLGLAVDFAVSGLKSDNFDKTKQYEWLVENAWKFGFIQTYPESAESLLKKEARLNHWRFVGVEEARVMMEEGLTILDCLNE